MTRAAASFFRQIPIPSKSTVKKQPLFVQAVPQVSQSISKHAALEMKRRRRKKFILMSQLASYLKIAGCERYCGD
jgi:hypothetical protein